MVNLHQSYSFLVHLKQLMGVENSTASVNMSSVGQLVPQVTRGPPNMTIKFSGPHIEGSFCTSIDYNYDPIISVICAMYIAFGIVYTLFGKLN